MRSMSAVAFFLLVGVVSLFPPSKAVAESQPYRSPDEAAAAAATELMAAFAEGGEGRVESAENDFITISVGSKHGVFEGERVRIYRRFPGRPIGTVRVSEVDKETCGGEVEVREVDWAIRKGYVARRQVNVAVLPLRNPQAEPDSDLGTLFAERVRHALQKVKPGFVEVVEREPEIVKALEDELGSGWRAILDEDTVRQVGKRFGADCVVWGILEVERNVIHAPDLRLVAVETGKRVDSAKVDWFATPPPKRTRKPWWIVVVAGLLWGVLDRGGDDGGAQAPAGFNVVIQ